MLRNDAPLDDTEPSPERQAELEQQYRANVAADRAPYHGVRIRTRGEVTWIMRQRKWSGKGTPEDDETRADFAEANFYEANLSHMQFQGANLTEAFMDRVNLSFADLSDAKLQNARLEEANLAGAELIVVNLRGADLDSCDLTGAVISDTDLRGAMLASCEMDIKTTLEGISIDTRTQFVDVRWNGAPLTLMDWSQAPVLGDETDAREVIDGFSKQRVQKSMKRRIRDYQNATRAYRQLAVALRSQGLNEEADHYAHRAQVMKRSVLWRQGFLRDKSHQVSVWYRFRKLAAYEVSWLLAVLAGYGYSPLSSTMAYFLIVGGFALAYHTLGAPAGHPAYHLSWLESVVVSVTAFHGRGFFAQQYAPSDPQSILAAGEAVIGLLIEITFIATFTNRFFAR